MKTHVSGLCVGDPSVPIWAPVQASYALRFTQLNTGQRIEFKDGVILTSLIVFSADLALRAPLEIDLALGTTEHGVDIFLGGSSEFGVADIWRRLPPNGKLWVEVTSGLLSLPVIVYLNCIT
jgi:hypothetical protein